SPDGNLIVTRDREGRASVFHADTGRLLARTPPAPIPDDDPLAVSPDGRLVRYANKKALASKDGTAWEEVPLELEAWRQDWPVIPPPSPLALTWQTKTEDLLSLSSAKSGATLTVRRDRSVRLKRASGEAALATRSEARAAAFSPDGQIVALAFADATCRLY